MSQRPARPDIHTVFREMLLSPDDQQCGKAIWYRGRRWVCARPIGHEGHCLRLDIELRYFNDHRPTFKSKYKTHCSRKDHEFYEARRKRMAAQPAEAEPQREEYDGPAADPMPGLDGAL